MSRLHPWAILLLTNVLRASCSGTGSLTFVIDDTLSMGDEIRQVKQSVNEIMDVIFQAKGSRVQNIVLVTFNDPVTTLRIKTTNRYDFRRVLDTVNVNNRNNLDWPEMSMTGTILGLENSHSDSFIYVFTDASPKDNWKNEQVKEMCQRKQSQIVFVITAPYEYFSWYPEYETYYQIAAACSGTVYVCEDKKIPDAIAIIKTKIQNNDTVLTTQEVKPNIRTFVKFIVDDHIDTVEIEATGEDITMEVNAPIQIQEKRLWRTHSKVLRLKSPPPGTYTAIVKSKSHAIVTISGTTDIFFKHGFSVLEPKYMANTAPQPFADTKSYLSVSVTDLEQALNVKSALILTTDEQRIIETLPLKQISKDFYTTIQFIAPSHKFKVGLIGTTKNTGATIRRIAKIPVTPAKPIKLPDKMKPRVEILEGKDTKIEYKSSVKLTCTVYAYPKPEIKWLNSNAQVVPSKSSLVQDPYKYVSYMQMDNAIKHNTYTCYAVNTKGNNSTSIKVNVKDPFEVKTVPEGSTSVKYGSEGVLNCKATSSWPITISWYYADATKGKDRKIETSESYWISDDGTQLKIKKMDTNLVGRYTCKISLNENQDFIKSFSTQVEAGGLELPKLAEDDQVKAIVGSKVKLYCRVQHGVPAPELIWTFNGRIIGHGNVLELPKVEVNHQGHYRCIAKNSLGDDERITKLVIQVPPKITNGGASTEVRVVEGADALNVPCSATGTPTPIITWELAGHRISNNDRYSIQNGVLTIKRPTVSDSGDYECVATNEVTSVRSKFRVHVDQKIKLDGEKNIIARIGTSVNIKCNVLTGWPKPKISWFFMDRPLSETKDVLHVDAVKETDAGNYKCVAENILGKVEHITELIVQYPPLILSNSTVYNVVVGDVALRIPCVVVGVPKPNIKWTWTDNTKGAVWDKSTDESATGKYVTEDGTLVIRNLSEIDSDEYTCHATNAIGSVDKAFQVTVTDEPEDFNNPHNIYIEEGTSKNISCSSKYFDPATKFTRWFMPNLETLNNTNYGYLLIENASDADTGNYTCRVSDKNGARTESYVVRVGKPPTFSAYQDGSLVKWFGDEPLQLDCKPTTNKLNDQIVWKYNGAVLPEATSMTLDAALKWGQYSCNLSNPLGSVQRTFDVTSQVCVMKKTYKETENMPLILGSKYTWPALESWSDYARLNPGEKLTLFCENDKRTSNGFLKFPSESNIIATCVKQDIFKVDGKEYKLSDLGCSKKVTPNIKRKNVKCLTETSELIGVGFNTPSGFVESYEVCFDHTNNIPLYSHALVTKLGRNISQSWNKVPELSVSQLDDTCDKTSCCYGKTTLTSNGYFEYSTRQSAAFIDPLNSIPYLKSCGSRNSTWLTIDQTLKEKLFMRDFPASIWSGVHTLQKINGKVIPRYLWKVLRTNKKDPVAIVHINAADPTPEDIKCVSLATLTEPTHVTNRLPAQSSSSICSQLTDKYTYCCKYADFMVAFGLEHNTDIGQLKKNVKV